MAVLIVPAEGWAKQAQNMETMRLGSNCKSQWFRVTGKL